MTGTIKIELTETERIETEDSVRVGQNIEMNVEIHNITREEKSVLLARFAQALNIDNQWIAMLHISQGYEMIACDGIEKKEATE